jgi:signal transduction histidine kinase
MTAELARDLAFELGAEPIELEEAYLAGLLHDIGELLLLGGFGARYAAVLSEARDERELAARENELFETDHATVAAWLVDQWALPSSMADAIAFHHLDAGAAAGLDRLGRILWSAHALLQSVPNDDGAAHAGALLGLAPERLGALATQARVLVAARLDEPAAQAHDIARPPSGTPAPVAGDPRLQAALSIPVALQSLLDDVDGPEGEASLLHGLAEAARQLFGLRHLVLLLVVGDGDALAAVPADAAPPALRRLRVPLQGTTALCVDAARERRLIATHDLPPAAARPAIDRQIAHALGSEGVVYVPMAARGALMGLLALGVSPVQLKLLEGRSDQLQEFANAAGRQIATWRGLRERERRAEAEVAARFALQSQRVAHEVGNPLAIIRSYLQLLAEDALESPERARADIGVLREEIDRLGSMVRQFATGRPDRAAESGHADLNVVLEGLRGLYGESLFGRAGMRLELRLASVPVPIAADADALKQVVINLWNNAAQALGGSGSVVTEVEPDVDHNGQRFAQLRIHDSGPGLPAAVREALYRPPTHDPAARAGERAGLGLSIVLPLVQRFGGAITCVSRPGEGTTFTVLVPLP